MNVPPVPNMREMVSVCQRNAEIAREKVDALKNTLRNMPPGVERERTLGMLSRCESDWHHWADYRGYYASRAAREGEGSVPSLGGFERFLRAPIARDTRLPREPGEDDEP